MSIPEEPRQRMKLENMVKAYWDFHKQKEERAFAFDYLLMCQNDYEAFCKEVIPILEESEKARYLEAGTLYGVQVEVFENEDLLRLRANELAGKKIGIVGEPKTNKVTKQLEQAHLNCAFILGNPSQIFRTIEVLCFQIDPHFVYMDKPMKSLLGEWLESEEKFQFVRELNTNELFGAEVVAFDTMAEAREAAKNVVNRRYVLVDYQAVFVS